MEAGCLRMILQNVVKSVQFGVYTSKCLGACLNVNHSFVDLGGVNSPCARLSRLVLLDGRSPLSQHEQWGASHG